MNIAAPPRITVRNAQRKIQLDVRSLQSFAERALREAMRLPQQPGSAFAGVAEIAAAIVSDARIADLHQRFMNIAGPTDVITFQHGEIIVSAETAQRNAVEYQTSTDREIRLYIIHGILHLMGFDDTTAAAARKMTTTQERIFVAASESSRSPSRPSRAV